MGLVKAGDHVVCPANGNDPCIPDKLHGPKTSGEDQPVSDEASSGVPTPLPSGPRRAWSGAARRSAKTGAQRGAAAASSAGYGPGYGAGGPAVAAQASCSSSLVIPNCRMNIVFPLPEGPTTAPRPKMPAVNTGEGTLERFSGIGGSLGKTK